MKTPLIKITLLLCVLTGALSSCATSESITSIDYLKPSQLIFPERINHVVLLDNAPKEDDIQSSLVMRYGSTKRKDIMSSFVNELAQTGYYEMITIADPKWASPIGTPLSEETFKKIEESTKPDLIITLGRLNAKDLDIPVENGEFIANSLIEIQPTFQLYNVKTNKISLYQPKDTVDLFEALIVSAISAQVDGSEQEVLEGSMIIGKQLSSYFAPYWKTVERIVFTDEPLFNASSREIKSNDLDKAILENESIYTNNKKTINKIKAAHNLAYIYELKDQLQTAYEWSKIAMQLSTDLFADKREKSVIYSYIQSYNITLEKRLRDLDILNRQLSKFEY